MTNKIIDIVQIVLVKGRCPNPTGKTIDHPLVLKDCQELIRLCSGSGEHSSMPRSVVTHHCTAWCLSLQATSRWTAGRENGCRGRPSGGRGSRSHIPSQTRTLQASITVATGQWNTGRTRYRIPVLVEQLGQQPRRVSLQRFRPVRAPAAYLEPRRILVSFHSLDRTRMHVHQHPPVPEEETTLQQPFTQPYFSISSCRPCLSWALSRGLHRPRAIPGVGARPCTPPR
jgi:hypothetical protein